MIRLLLPFPARRFLHSLAKDVPKFSTACSFSSVLHSSERAYAAQPSCRIRVDDAGRLMKSQ